MKKIIFLSFVFSASIAFSQRNDFVWILGYDYDPATPETENIVMDFNENQLSYSYQNMNVKMGITNVSYSNDNGDLLLYSNGCRIYNRSTEVIPNSDSLNIGYGYKEFCVNFGGYNIFDNGVLLPLGFKEDKFVYFSDGIFYQWQPVFIGYFARLSYHMLEIDPLTQNWAMSEKNVPILYDTISGGHIEAVRHANGRDWWVVVSQLNTNLY